MCYTDVNDYNIIKKNVAIRRHFVSRIEKKCKLPLQKQYKEQRKLLFSCKDETTQQDDKRE